ncbi:protein O-mannosyl-transferase TMTC4-like [Mercenaria mercenaria]|uniref:protein O-mannosyl-transferase TMTC4-like n=1 Tax=Mercenaria mercenaria TaxID=6596 RepID=UPI00234E864B|nr:protein O-mannosyl-transferase TMTC4-like [Mercenaria mercenaria]
MFYKKSQHRHKNGYRNGYHMNGTAANGAPLEPEYSEPEAPLRPNPEKFLPIPRLKFGTAAAIVFLISVVCFAVSYDGDLVFDDSEAIIGNKDLLPETPISNIFFNDFWGKKLDSKTSHKSYRPLTVLTFRLSYYVGGGLEPIYFHIPNIILHGIVSVLILRTFSILFGSYTVDVDSGETQFMAARSSVLCALLFAVHPIHTESVSGVVGRADLLCAVLFISSFLLYVKACASDLHKKDDRLTIFRPTSFSMQYMLASMLLCGLSVFCKEQGLTVIGICSAYDIIVVCGVDILELVGLRRRPRRHAVSNTNGNGNAKSEESSIPPWVLSAIKRHIFLIVTGMMVLLFRWRIMGSTPPTFQVFDNPHSFANGTVIRGLNYNYLYSINAWLLLNPWWLCFDWSMGCIPVIENFYDGRILAVVTVWTILGTLLWTCLKGPITQDQRTLTMALALIIVPFLPASNLFFRVGFVIAERILYLSSIGFCMLVVLGVRHICVTFPKYSKYMLLGTLLLLSVYTVRCIQRSSQWRNEMELFSSGPQVCPGNAKVHYNIGKLHADNGNTEYAITKYRQAITLNPEYDQAMNNLGNILKDKDELFEAEQLLERAVSIRKEFAAAWMNLGIVKASLKKHEEAEKCYVTAITHRRKYPDCYYNLGNLYLEVKQYDRAVEAWTNATNLKPTHSQAWINMAVVYDNIERFEESIAVTMKALRHLPEEPQLYFNLGNVYGKKAKFEESEKYFQRAIKLSPNNAKFVANMAVLYHRWEKYDKAEAAYLKALSINPAEPNVQQNLAMLHRKMNKKTS